jgi:RimJ/RimL family protein N-acetyltransferase/AcrR family transcriptional regulator
VSRAGTGNRGGRPAAATREEVLELARDRYLSGRRVDLTELAAALGLGRATLYRWFGSREALLGEVIVEAFETLVARAAERIDPVGGDGLLALCDALNQSLARSTALRRFVESEPEVALRLLTAVDGPVQPRTVAAMQRLIEREMRAGRLQGPADPGTLAYAIVRLAEAFLYGDAAAGVRGDVVRLHSVEAALLGVMEPGWTDVSPSPPPPRFSLRALAASDGPELRRILATPEIRSRWGETPDGFPFEDDDAARFTIRAGGRVVGLIQYYEILDPQYRHATIDLFLEAGWQGQGIGTAAIRRIVERLLAAGHHRITIDPAADNLPAIRACAAAGFRAVGVLRAYERDAEGSGFHDGLLMEYAVRGAE